MTDMAETMPRSAVAPWRHTLILAPSCSALLPPVPQRAISRMARAPRRTCAGGAGLTTYPLLVLAEYGLFTVIRRGIRKRGVRVVDLISARPLTLRAGAVDL